MIRDETFAYRRHLPHLERERQWYFVTFATRQRFVLPAVARDIALRTCAHDHEKTYWLETAVIMPDHVHLLFSPLSGWRLGSILQRIKGTSSHLINRAIQRKGPLWQDECFDRLIRSDEDIVKKGNHILANPVRAGLVAHEHDYPWTWSSWRK
jgi:REP element-mobilizing transposase RayT